MKENCIIVGAGTYGQVYAEYLSERYNILGYIDDDFTLHNLEINGIKILGGFDYLNKVDTSTNVFIPIGNNKIRVKLLQETIKKGFKTPCFIHPAADVHPSVKVGKAVYILPGTQIMPLTVIEDFVLISMGVNIAHHTSVSEGCFFSQGSNIGANIAFAVNVFCGIASTVMTGVKRVGRDSIVGAGAVIIRDVPDDAVVVGNPGKIIKYNNQD